MWLRDVSPRNQADGCVPLDIKQVVSERDLDIPGYLLCNLVRDVAGILGLTQVGCDLHSAKAGLATPVVMEGLETYLTLLGL